MSYIPAIREFIVENFLFGDGDQIKNNTQFFEKGIIDSTGVLELVSFIEETYQVIIEDDELIPENFSSLETIDKYLSQKMNIPA